MKQEKTTVEMQKEIDKNSLYSIIMYYQGGTYISQVKAKEIKDALILWIKNLDVSAIENFSNEDKKELQNLVIEETPCLIDGMENIWYADFLLGKNYMHAHIIKTEGSIHDLADL